MGKSVSKNQMVKNPAANPGVENPRTVQARDALQQYPDQYFRDQDLPDGSVCPKCHLIWENQHWTEDRKRAQLLLEAGTPNIAMCPGCSAVTDRLPQGIVTLKGDYWPEHREEILNLVRNEESENLRANPLARIMDIREEEGNLIIETTNEKLAQKIGRSINKAHNGNVEYQWSDGNHLVRVYWERQLQERKAA